MKTDFNNNYGTVNTAPCKNCKRRHSGCHMHCRDYFAYKLEIAEVKRLKAREKNLEWEANYDKSY